MKLLLDQNLSWRLAGSLQDLFPGSAHVREHVVREHAARIQEFADAETESFMVLP